MRIDFLNVECQKTLSTKLFGICDDLPPPHRPAYVDEKDGSKWVAVIVNDDNYEVTFTAIDHCIVINRPDGKPAKRCDGVLTYRSTIIFLELKEIGTKGNAWVTTAEEQLRITIGYFELSNDLRIFDNKKAYIANSERPKFRESQLRRMSQFFEDTGYVLRIENRIILQ